MPVLLARSMWIPELPAWEIVFRAAVIYVFIQLLFRVAGRKEFGRWGASDIVLLFLVTTSARNSIVAEDSSLTAAMIALTTIVFLDWLVSLATSRSRRAADVLEGSPAQLVRDGALQRDVMRRTRISEDELLARAREMGRASLGDVKDAFLERSGKITLVLRERTA